MRHKLHADVHILGWIVPWQTQLSKWGDRMSEQEMLDRECRGDVDDLIFRDPEWRTSDR